MPIKFIVILLIAIVSISSLTIDSFAEEGPKKKVAFGGDHQMLFFHDPVLSQRHTSFSGIPYEPSPYTIVKSDVRVGTEKLTLYGGGFLKPDKYVYDKTCKDVSGYENLFSLKGDFVKLEYVGKVCTISPAKKIVSVVFKGSDGKGVFDGYNISGTLTGISDIYERQYNLEFNSILVTKPTSNVYTLEITN